MTVQLEDPHVIGCCCAGALKDNGRASVIGDSATYGKGKIQSVYELADGSALFVTIARYKTPVRTWLYTVLMLCERS